VCSTYRINVIPAQVHGPRVSAINVRNERRKSPEGEEKNDVRRRINEPREDSHDSANRDEGGVTRCVRIQPSDTGHGIAGLGTSRSVFRIHGAGGPKRRTKTARTSDCNREE